MRMERKDQIGEKSQRRLMHFYSHSSGKKKIFFFVFLIVCFEDFNENYRKMFNFSVF